MSRQPALVGDVVAFAPGRVNLIGDHTDYSDGLVLPMAIQLGTTVTFSVEGQRIRLRSADETDPVDLPLSLADPAAVSPGWGRYVAGVIAELAPAVGGHGQVSTTLPIGAGLSSSAALEVAVALALGFAGTPIELALACQRAEQRASGVPCGIMDQLTSAAGIGGAALLIDCRTNDVLPVEIPDGCEIVAVHSGEPRRLADSAYADRRRDGEQAAEVIGPLRDAELSDLDSLADPLMRRRARHVLTENARVTDFVAAMAAGDLVHAGNLMKASHASLRDDFEVSTPKLDWLVADLSARPGVFGARLTGAGFGGCVVAMGTPGAIREGWKLVASPGARLVRT